MQGNQYAEIEDLRCERLHENYDKIALHKRLLKVIILGDTGKFIPSRHCAQESISFLLGIGKSCILTRLTKDSFDTEHNVTVGVDFGSCLIKVEDSVLKLQIWDTAGQESFRSITKIFYRSADAVILGYSITDRATFDNLKAWMREVREQCYPDVMLFLVGNKSDLEQERRVSKAMA